MKLQARIRKLIFQGFSIDKGKDRFTHSEHFEKILDFVQKEAPETNLFYAMSDGAPGSYKSSGALLEKKIKAVEHKINIMSCFCPTGCGKGEHDREGGHTASLYKRECAPCLGTEARNLDMVVTWNEENRSFMKSKKSATEKRLFFHSPYETIAERREKAVEVGTLFCKDKGFMTRKNYCYFASSDPDEKGLWYRKYSCVTCDLCRTGDWKNIKNCSNTICGKWRYIPFEEVPISKKQEAANSKKVKKRKLESNYVNPKKLYICACGLTISRTNFYGHEKRKKHMKYLKKLKDNKIN